MKKHKVKGTVVYQKLATGFWGIIDDNSQQWQPVNMPDQLKKQEARVSVTLEEIDDSVSIFMWGTPVRIISFHTLS